LRALVRGQWGDRDYRSGTFPGGSTLIDGGRGWVLAETEPARSLGAALAWAANTGIDELHVLSSADAGVLARRAELFARPPTVWAVVERDVSPASPARYEAALPAPAGAARYADVLRSAGVEPVIEHGVLRGEVLGVEVARVEDVDGELVLRVGVSAQDRDAHAMVHADKPTADALADVAATVRAHRRGSGHPHPLQRLSAERWLRCVLVEDPGLAGAAHLAPVASTLAPGDPMRPGSAAAAGEDRDGRPLLVVCSTGIDLDLVPSAADARAADPRQPELVIAVPARDDHPVTRALASSLSAPATIVAVPDDWRRP
jgi:hypothetical protein